MKRFHLKENNFHTMLNYVVRVLVKGGLVVFPSDTVYGLLVDSTNEKAVVKLIEFKERPAGKPISVFVTNIRMIDTLCNVSGKQENILKEILPGPFTIVLDYKNKQSKFKLCKSLLSEQNTLGVRIPDYEPVIKLVESFKRPITATSANTVGMPAYHLTESLIKNLSIKKKTLIDLIVDAGKLPLNKPSTVIDLTRDKIKELRKGDFSVKNIKKYISESSEETKLIAKTFSKKVFKNQQKSTVLILQGELGSGKTVFIKGVGEFLGIKNVISPSFVVYYEYEIKSQKSSRFAKASRDKKVKSQKFIHGDFYYIKDDQELKDLKLDNYVNNSNILCFEWGERAGVLLDLFKSRCKVFLIKIKYLSETKRELRIGELNK